jgi:DNA-binding HxlR family transcriptional regulator
LPQRPYGLLCPITHACEVLGPRWTIQILTELWNGSTRFNDIRKGVGHISTALLSKRLKELEAAGLVERIEDKLAGTIDYIRTDKAIRLEPALDALAEWAQCNIEADLVLCHTDVATLMWHLRRWRIDSSELPNRRVVIRFHFNDDPPPNFPTYWLVTNPSDVLPGLCMSDPGVDVDLYVETSVTSFGGLLLGRTNVAREIERGALFLSGDALLGRTMQKWIRSSSYSTFEGIAELSAAR